MLLFSINITCYRFWPVAGTLALWACCASGRAAEHRPAFPTAISMLDLNGMAISPFDHAGAKGVVFLFVSVECPISNSYLPECQRLHDEFSPKGWEVELVYPNPDESGAAIRKHLNEYKCTIPAFRDPRHELVRVARVRVTPEAAVFVRGRGLVYHGRIDNRHVELGKARASATTHDLRDALEALLKGQLPKTDSLPAVGCYIAESRERSQASP